MSSKNKICDVLKRKRVVISLKTKLEQIENSDSMSYLKFDLRYLFPKHSTTQVEGIFYIP